MTEPREEFRCKGVTVFLFHKEAQFDIVKYEKDPLLHLEPYMPYFDDNGCRYYTDKPYLTGEEERIWHRNFIKFDSTPLSEKEKKLFNSAIGKVIDFTSTIDTQPEMYDKALSEEICRFLLPTFSRAYEDATGKPFTFTSSF